MKIASALEEKVLFRLTDSELITKASATTIIMKLIEGPFPNYSSVIPEAHVGKAIFNKDELKKALILIGNACDKETACLRLTIRSDGAVFKSGDNSLFDGSMSIGVNLEGRDVDFKISYKYLLDVIEHIIEEDVTLYLNGPEDPVKLVSGDFTHIIMPRKW